MNIIGDVRDALLHAVEKRSPPPRTPMDLWTVLKDEWCELPPRYLQTLVESMPHLVAALLCVRGTLHDIRQVYQFFGFSVHLLGRRVLDSNDILNVDLPLRLSQWCANRGSQSPKGS
ncbi:hypothetical protein AVEN_120601-1 [Araneus ventricosus]|uniref:Uncharacterized protein n=1 Tax=Araneus ventricosus TaxID=182803 RepID=A0A4Y2LDH0_ARAVE|nr:hypothetical protein AVEN_120601-1 [Araneus ventricosus]